MDRVVILGSASAVPDLQHENTHMLVQAEARTILVDCPGSPVVRLAQVGVELSSLTDIILTHFHPDHVSGFAPLVMSMWLLGRKEPLNVYGLESTLDRTKTMMELYDWMDWPNFFPINYIHIPKVEGATLMEGSGLSVHASPVKHMIPAVGLRFTFHQKGCSLAYSCDTEPSPVVQRMAKGADILIHESTGDSVGHTSPERAGEIATQAGVKTLYLIHYPPQLVTPEELLKRARKTFDGKVVVAEDFMTIDM